MSETEKGRRLEVLIAEQEARAGRINRATIGQVTEVLAESNAKRQANWLRGKNPQFKTVVFEPAGNTQIGELAHVLIESAGPHTLCGRQVSPNPA